MRVIQFLAGVTVATAASATVDCGADSCSSCTGTGVAQVCVRYDAPQTPSCGVCANLCSANMGGAADAQCNVCVPGLLSSIGRCVSTTVGVAPYVSARTSFDAGLSLTTVFANALVSINASASASAAVNVDANSVAVVSGVNTIATLNTGASGSMTASSNVIVQVNASLTVNAWNNNAETTKVNNNNAGSLVIGNLAVGGTKFAVWQDSSASVAFSNIDFGTSATLQVSGGSAQFKARSSTDASANITGTGTIHFSGGVSVEGNFAAGVTLNVSGTGSAGPLLVVDATKNVVVSGNVQTNADVDQQGSVSVNGNFAIISAAAQIDPKVIVNTGASFAVNSTNSFVAKSLEIKEGATLVIGAKANRAQTTFTNFVNCVGTVRVHLDTSASAFVDANGATGAVAFKYGSNSNATQLAQCAVQVWDSLGNKYTLTSRTSASASAGRRLLESSGTATWGSDSMTVQMDKTQTAGAASVSFVVAPLLVAVGLMF